ncbi:uncharacterized protein H6S33_004952 [Morchella sextelata]|uniref:uncharacterized protein n=1 Tax=Morchella sextelata TaxID=1174677 RepID=UPI001D044A2B|nr:uncharacterized protein H6S33_004952 [Morchella sextelata]KAH0604970.1 hypothetical protein H6S33_004952 [Morchella sextelata]
MNGFQLGLTKRIKCFSPHVARRQTWIPISDSVGHEPSLLPDRAPDSSVLLDRMTSGSDRTAWTEKQHDDSDHDIRKEGYLSGDVAGHRVLIRHVEKDWRSLSSIGHYWQTNSVDEMGNTIEGGEAKHGIPGDDTIAGKFIKVDASITNIKTELQELKSKVDEGFKGLNSWIRILVGTGIFGVGLKIFYYDAKMQQQSETRMTTMIENALKTTKNELLLNQARLEIKSMEKIGGLKKENANQLRGSGGVTLCDSPF